jgi:hypothetical protein
MSHTLAICGSGVVGAFCAVMADIAIKDTAGAIPKLTTGAKNVLDIPVPAYFIALVFLVLAALLCMIFKTETPIDSFKLGVGVIATVMMGVPPAATSTLPVSIRSTTEKAAMVEPSGAWSIAHASGSTAAEIPSDKASASEQKGTVRVDVRSGKETKGFNQMTITLKDARTEEMLARSTHYFGADQPQRPLQGAELEFERRAGDYKIFVEVPGYVIDIQPLKVDAGVKRTVTVNLEPSWIPVFFQRMWR